MSKNWCPVALDGDWTILKYIESDGGYKSLQNKGLTTNELIYAFKQTTFFKELTTSSETIAVYVVGSRAIGLDKPTSDLDLIVIVDNQDVDYTGKTADTRLAYKDIPVHWRFYNYKELFYIETTGNMLAVFRQQLCYKQPLPIYLSARGEKLNDYLIKNKNYLNTLGAKLVAFSYKDSLALHKNNLLQNATIHKYLYHLIMSNEILSGTTDNFAVLYNTKVASTRDYNYLVETGLIAILEDKLNQLSTKIENLDYEELKTQTKAVNLDIYNIVNA